MSITGGISQPLCQSGRPISKRPGATTSLYECITQHGHHIDTHASISLISFLFKKVVLPASVCESQE